MPLFERNQINGVDGISEEHVYAQTLQSQQNRIDALEKICRDLERRLENQAKQTMAVEAECMAIERSWQGKCAEYEREIKKWQAEYQAEKSKGDKVREQLQRSERELYGILQRKYELMRGPGSLRPQAAGGAAASAAGGGSSSGGIGGSGGGAGGGPGAKSFAEHMALKSDMSWDELSVNKVSVFLLSWSALACRSMLARFCPLSGSIRRNSDTLVAASSPRFVCSSLQLTAERAEEEQREARADQFVGLLGLLAPWSLLSSFSRSTHFSLSIVPRVHS